MLIPVRGGSDLYANVWPVRLMLGVPRPLQDSDEIDFVVVRGNAEGEYSSVGGHIAKGVEHGTVLE